MLLVGSDLCLIFNISYFKMLYEEIYVSKLHSLVAIGFCPKKNIEKLIFLYLFCIGVVSTL